MNLIRTGTPLYPRENNARIRGATLSFWDIFVKFIVGIILIKFRHLRAAKHYEDLTTVHNVLPSVD